MNKNAFDIGEVVTVCMSRNDCFPNLSIRFEATIAYTPQASGDCWRVETLDGQAIMLNPMSSDFVGFASVDKTSADPDDDRPF